MSEISVVGLREPCPCGSGRRYKACHGKVSAPSVQRPFAGLANEPDWVALREIVPAATAPLRLIGNPTPITLASILPMAWPALHRNDGELFLGLQVQGGSGDASRDLAHALERAMAAEPGTPIETLGRPGPGPRLQDLIDPTFPLVVELHEGLDFWLAAGADITDEVRESLAQANSAVVPSERLTSVEAAYWCRIAGKEFLRWVLPQDEDRLTDGFAKLKVRGAERLGSGTKFVGAFRADGLLVPVWELVPGATAAEYEEPAAQFKTRLDEVLAQASPLTTEERRVRGGIISRQVTLR